MRAATPPHARRRYPTGTSQRARWWPRILIGFLGLAIGARAGATLGTASHTGDGDKPTSQLQPLDLKPIWQRLDKQAEHPLVRRVPFGQSLQGRPLVAFEVGLIKPPRRGPVVLISGATHGNEYMGIVDRFPAWLAREATQPGAVADFFNQGGQVLIIPLVNPDGVVRRVRHNAAAADLNRDFPFFGRVGGLRQRESRSLAKLVREHLGERRLALTVDYHCCGSAILFPWLPKRDAAHFRAAHGALASTMIKSLGRGFRAGTTGSILGYRPQGTSKDFYHHEFGALAFTLEGEDLKEARYRARHYKMWRRVLASLVD